jgi:Secretion system C-terminal sorting domain
MSFPEIIVSITEVRITVTAGFTSGLFGGSWDTWISVDQMGDTETAVDKSPELLNYSLWPNPAHDIVYVSTGYSGMASLIDSKGNTTKKLISQGVMDVSDLAAGIYIVKFNDRSYKLVID